MLKKVGQILLIPVLLLSTMGLTINMHYCQHKLYDIGVFGKAQNCCMPNKNAHQKKAHHCHQNNHHSDDCRDETVQIDKVDNFVVSSFNFNFEDIPFSKLFVFYSILADYNSTPVDQQIEFPVLNISPPGTHIVLSLLQTYLI